MRLKVYWGAVGGEIESYEIQYTIHVPKLNKFSIKGFSNKYSNSMKVRVEDCQSEDGQYYFEIKNIPSNFVIAYYESLKAFKCKVRVRAIGKNGKEGSWSKKVKVTDGSKEERVPSIKSIWISEKEESIYYDNEMFADERPWINLGGKNLKEVDEMGVAKLNDESKNILKKLKKGKRVTTKLLSIKTNTQKDNFVCGELQENLSEGEYLVFVKAKGVVNTGIVTIKVRDAKQKFGAWKFEPEVLSSNLKYQVLIAEGYGFDELTKLKDYNHFKKFMTGAAIGGVVGGVIGGASGALFHPLESMKVLWAGLVKASQYVVVGVNLIPALAQNVIAGAGLGAFSGGLISLMASYADEAKYTTDRSKIRRLLYGLAKNSKDPKDLIIPIKRDVEGNHSGKYLRTRNKFIKDTKEILPWAEDVFEKADFWLNSGLFQIMDGKNLAKGIFVNTVTLQNPRLYLENEVDKKNILRFIIEIDNKELQMEGEEKTYKLIAEFKRVDKWMPVGEIKLSKSLGRIRGKVIVDGEFLDSQEGFAVDSLVELKKQKK